MVALTVTLAVTPLMLNFSHLFNVQVFFTDQPCERMTQEQSSISESLSDNKQVSNEQTEANECR